MLKHNNKKSSPTKVAFIAALIIIVGGFFLLYDYIESKKVLAYDYISNYYYNGEELVEKEPEYEIEEKEDIKEEKEEEEGPVTDEYIGYLTIPKINLTKGFVDKRSSENDVEKNILVIDGSDYPDVEKGNFILAGHSGTGWKAFFNELYQLKGDDIAEVTYKGKKYIYKVVNIYRQPKVGKVAIYRNYDKTTLTLITCTNNDQTTQTIYIFELTSIEE